MSSGIQHQRATIATTVLIGFVGISAEFNYTFFLMLGCISGTLLSPDLDLNQVRTQSEQLLYNVPIVGCLLGSVWEYYWIIYGLVLPHRSFFSHAPFFSTIGRLLYGLPIMFPFWMLLWNERPTMFYYVGGLMIADTVHFLMDFRPHFN